MAALAFKQAGDTANERFCTARLYKSLGDAASKRKDSYEARSKYLLAAREFESMGEPAALRQSAICYELAGHIAQAATLLHTLGDAIGAANILLKARKWVEAAQYVLLSCRFPFCSRHDILLVQGFLCGQRF